MDPITFTPLPIIGAFIVKLAHQIDNRGGFSRIFCANQFSKIDITDPIVQINHSFNNYAGTIRGLHLQRSPHQEIKLIRCIKGRVFDVILDLRENSPTFLKHINVELTHTDKTMVVVPKGCAHGFQTLEDNSELIYYHTNFYFPESEDGVRYNDPSIDINWPLSPRNISNRDSQFSNIKLNEI